MHVHTHMQYPHAHTCSTHAAHSYVYPICICTHHHTHSLHTCTHYVHPIYVDMCTPLRTMCACTHTHTHARTHTHTHTRTNTHSKAKNMVAMQNTATAAQWTSTGMPVHRSTQALGTSAGKNPRTSSPQKDYSGLAEREVVEPEVPQWPITNNEICLPSKHQVLTDVTAGSPGHQVLIKTAG